MEIRIHTTNEKMRKTVAVCFLIAIGCCGNALGQDGTERNTAYTVLPGDELQISVWKEPDLQQSVLVRPDSAFSFPLAGDISTKGLSVFFRSDGNQSLFERLSAPNTLLKASQIG